MSKATMRLRSTASVRGSFQNLWKVGRERENTCTRLGTEKPLIGLALELMILLKRIESAQMLVPVGFELIRNQAIIGIHLQIPTTCKLGLVTRTLELLTTQRVCRLDTTSDLILDGQGDLESRRRHPLEQHRTDCRIDVTATDGLEDLRSAT
jgi:hypothetical protein